MQSPHVSNHSLFWSFSSLGDNKKDIENHQTYSISQRRRERMTGVGGGWMSPDREAKWGSWTPGSLLSISSLPTASLEQSSTTLAVHQGTWTSPLVSVSGPGRASPRRLVHISLNGNKGQRSWKSCYLSVSVLIEVTELCQSCPKGNG